MNPCVTLASLPLDDAEVFTSPSLFFFFIVQLTFYLSSKVFHRGKQSSITRAERNHYTDDSQVGPVYRTTSAADRDFLNGLGRPHKNPPRCATIIAIKWAVADLIVSSLFGRARHAGYVKEGHRERWFKSWTEAKGGEAIDVIQTLLMNALQDNVCGAASRYKRP